MNGKIKFTITYADGLWKVTLWADNKRKEVQTFCFHSEVMHYISNTMCSLQVAQENWTFSYN